VSSDTLPGFEVVTLGNEILINMDPDCWAFPDDAGDLDLAGGLLRFVYRPLNATTRVEIRDAITIRLIEATRSEELIRTWKGWETRVGQKRREARCIGYFGDCGEVWTRDGLIELYSEGRTQMTHEQAQTLIDLLRKAIT
jgi:hypothetical protein